MIQRNPGPFDPDSFKRRKRRISLPVLFIGAVLIGIIASVGVLYAWQHPFSHQEAKQATAQKNATPSPQSHIYPLR
ncbi:MAG TPA: hypothetical protein VL485_24275 [Ktedonobacteraceae bacterium]|nr:hypothetical protein [Ktedonobacteraceae bacterium]